MARSNRDTLIYATILLAPMVTAIVSIAHAPVQVEEVLVTRIPSCPAPAPAAVDPPVPAPVPEPAPQITEDPADLLAGAGMLMHKQDLVVSTAPDAAWTRGKLQGKVTAYEATAYKFVDVARLPATLAPLADTGVVVYDRDGSACTARTTPGQLTVWGSQTGELDLLLTDGEVPEDGKFTAAGQRTLRRQIFADAQMLRARLRRDAGEPCQGLWARAAALPAPAVFGARELDSAAEQALRDRLRPLLAVHPAVKELRAAYARHTRGDREAGSWDEVVFSHLDITRWDEVGGARSFVNVVVGDGGESCSSLFGEQRGVMFTLTGDELAPHADPGFLAPSALMDLEHDGHLEAVTDGGHHLESRGPAGTLQRFEVPYHGCPC